MRQFLREKVSVTAPKGSFAVADERTHTLAQSAGRDALHKGLERFVYTAQRKRETSKLSALPVDGSHPNFPTVRTEDGEVPAYRLEVPEDLVKELDRLISKLAVGDATIGGHRRAAPSAAPGRPSVRAAAPEGDQHR